ncbi:cell division protein FtsZ [Crocinitomicaceae bacterium]|nr:cell division protein FtsZ [Crocinitomicaceae bacterium]MDC1385191.1 cell division protein FtsZ [Crocinitomicaceae bacterium]|tara:strand:- start:4106 stop:5725 length:1620 start_codon:yes stop_codon:yes gene_type:complete
MDFDLPKDNQPSIIKVIGVGGGGGNAVNHMFSEGIVGVDFIVCNTDLQALDISPVPYKIQLGPSLTEGRGAGSLPEIGKNAAVENIEEIREFLSKDTKMVFVTAGMGGGTGTGAAPVIAQVAKELGILTVGIVTVPFNFEGRKRRIQAEAGLEEMRQSVDTLLVINNERLREITGNLSIGEAFTQADEILATAAKGIAEVIAVTGAINVDFNDVNTVMRDSGVAIMGSAAVEGDNRAIKAVEQALESPLLNDNDISGAEYVLLNITYGDKEVLMDEITEITDYIQDAAGSTADVIFGHAKDGSLGDKISVTVIATGFQSTPITGFETAPKKNVTTLEEDKKNEVLAPMNSPTQAIPWAGAKEIVAEDEPFLKSETEVEVKETPSQSWNGFVGQTYQEDAETKDKEELDLDWNVTNTTEEADEPLLKVEEPKEEVKRFTLEDDMEEMDLDTVNTKESVSPKVQQERSKERLSKIQEYTQRLKKADGIQDLENEPAYIRRNIILDESIPSEEDNTSRFSVSSDEKGSSLSGNNSFLHDNVD